MGEMQDKEDRIADLKSDIKFEREQMRPVRDSLRVLLECAEKGDIPEQEAIWAAQSALAGLQCSIGDLGDEVKPDRHPDPKWPHFLNDPVVIRPDDEGHEVAVIPGLLQTPRDQEDENEYLRVRLAEVTSERNTLINKLKVAEAKLRKK